MSSENDLSDLYKALGLTPSGQAYVKRVRASDPSRKVQGGRGNVCVRYASRKMRHTVQCESRKPEFMFAVHSEFDDNILEYWDQPEALKLTYLSAAGRNLSHFHTPDFLVLGSDEITLVSCKTESELQQLAKDSPYLYRHNPDGSWSCPPGEAAAFEQGLRYRVVSTAELSPILVRNCEFLKDYRIGAPDLISAGADISIAEFFEKNKYAKLKELLDAVGSADSVYQALLEARFFFHINRDLLARPESAFVYAEPVYATVIEAVGTNGGATEVSVPQVAFEPGADILWDEVPWQVFNVAADTLTLGGENGALLTLEKSQVLGLLKEGRLHGVRSSDNAKVRKLLLSAGPDQLKLALKKHKAIAPLLEEENRAHLTVPGRTARYWRRKFKRGLLAFGHGLLGLLPAKRPGNTNPRLSPRVEELITKSVEKVYGTPTAPTIKAAHAVFVGWCRDEHLTPASYKTYCGRVNHLKLTRARHGDKEAYQAAGPVESEGTYLPPHGDRAFEVAHIDHTLIELVVISSVTGEALDRLWLTLMIDAYSRVVLAHYLTFDPPSYRSLMMVLRECVRRHGRLPDKIVVDRGKEFESIYFETLLAFFGISKFSRPPGQPRFGSIVERGFGSVQTSLFHTLAGNTQNLSLGRSASASHHPERNAVWTADALDAELCDWLYNVYPTLRHHGILEAPLERMQRSLKESGLRKHRFIAYDESFLILTLPAPDSSARRVRPKIGIRLNHFDYLVPEVGVKLPKGRKVEVRYDPFDPSYIYAYVAGKWIQCHSRNHLLREYTERDIKFAADELRQLARLTGREYRLTPERLVLHLQQRHEKQAQLQKERKALQARYARASEADSPARPAHPAPDIEVEVNGKDCYPITTLSNED